MVKIIPTIETTLDDEPNRRNNEATRKGCYGKFASRYELIRHLKNNKDCLTLHKLDKVTMKKCQVCNTWWGNDEELEKHKKYHCRLNPKGGEYFSINNEMPLN